jgi:hypothetical protein
LEKKTKWVVLDDYNRLSSLLKQLDNVPEDRQDLTKMTNIRWLSRNLRINREGQTLEEAMRLVRKILKESIRNGKN